MRVTVKKLMKALILLVMGSVLVVLIISLVTCCTDLLFDGEDEFTFPDKNQIINQKYHHITRSPNKNHLHQLNNAVEKIFKDKEIKQDKNSALIKSTNEKQDYNTVNKSFHSLIGQIKSRWQFDWIRERLLKIWPEFEAAGRILTNNCTNQQGNIKKLMILPGLLTLTNFARRDVIEAGGPLGELAQWADLIAGALALCHRVVLRLNIPSTGIELNVEKEEDEVRRVGCRGEGYVEVIYTDIGGYRALPADISDNYRYKFRILDAFGTEPAYNDPEYARMNGIAINHWGTLGLRPKQFYTFYPHTPDNSFLSFIVPSSKLITATAKQNFALVIGKVPTYLQGKREVLETISRVMRVKITMKTDGYWNLVPPGVESLGVLKSGEYKSLLSTARVCIGLGDPIESPTAIEVLAAGCVFLNPKRLGERRVLAGKPTSRKVCSQVPYLSDFVGPPYTYLYNEQNLTQLKEILKTILSTEPPQPFIPYEFTVPGYLERLDAFISYQNFCRGNASDQYNGKSAADRWPPVKALQPIIAREDTSCAKACHENGKICEPDFFALVNNADFMNKLGISCGKVEKKAELYAPAFSDLSKTCFLQSRNEIFSCAGGEERGVKRVCPCRDFIKYQTALCQDCRRVNPGKNQTSTKVT